MVFDKVPHIQNKAEKGQSTGHTQDPFIPLRARSTMTLILPGIILSQTPPPWRPENSLCHLIFSSVNPPQCCSLISDNPPPLFPPCLKPGRFFSFSTDFCTKFSKFLANLKLIMICRLQEYTILNLKTENNSIEQTQLTEPLSVVLWQFELYQRNKHASNCFKLFILSCGGFLSNRTTGNINLLKNMAAQSGQKLLIKLEAFLSSLWDWFVCLWTLSNWRFILLYISFLTQPMLYISPLWWVYLSFLSEWADLFTNILKYMFLQ